MKKTYQRHWLLVAIAAGGLSGCVAMRSDVQRVEAQMMKYNARLANVEGTASELESTLDEQTTGAKEAVFARLNEAQDVSRQMRAQIAALEEGLRVLRGEVSLLREELGLYSAAGSTDASPGRSQGSIAERLARVEAMTQGLEGQIAQQSVAEISDQKLYDEGRAFFGEGKYADAEARFELMIRSFPKSSLAPSARFWVGETYYKREQYINALKHYKESGKYFFHSCIYCSR